MGVGSSVRREWTKSFNLRHKYFFERDVKIWLWITGWRASEDIKEADEAEN